MADESAPSPAAAERQMVIEAEERERQRRIAEYEESTTTTTTTTTTVSFSMPLPAGTMKLSVVSDGGSASPAARRQRPEEREQAGHMGVLSGIVRAHELRVEEEQRVKQQALERQQRVAALQAGSPPAAAPPLATLDEAKSRLAQLETELAKYRGDSIDYLPLLQLRQLEAALAASLAKVTARRKTIEARRQQNFRSCVVCCDHSRRIVFQCGHLVACDACSLALTLCPICRDRIETRIPIKGALFDEDDEVS